MDPQVIANEQPTENPERRTSRRGRALLAGKLVYGDGFSADCTIRDLTATGAKVTLPAHQLVPKDFYLIVIRDGMAHKARTLWTRYPHAGLEFESSHDLGDAMPAALRPLKHLWAALSPRTY